MKRVLFALTLLMVFLGLGAGAQAQTVTVQGSNFKDSKGVPINGTITFQPVVGNSPASYQLPGGGVGVILPVTTTITGGSFTLTLPDTSQTNPVNMCFAVGGSQQYTNKPLLGPGYSCVQPHYTATGSSDWCQAGNCDFDKYVPNLASQSVVQVSGPAGTVAIGSVTQGSTGSAAAVTNSGTATAAVFNFVIPTAPSATDTNSLHINTTAMQSMTGPLGFSLTNPVGCGSGQPAQTCPHWDSTIWQGSTAPGFGLQAFSSWYGLSTQMGGDYGYSGSGSEGWTEYQPTNWTLKNMGMGQIQQIRNYTQASQGDFAMDYLYGHFYGGVIAPTDEGPHVRGINFYEGPSIASGTVPTFGGTISTGGSGATQLTVNCATDCGNQGDGRMTLDLSQPIAAGNETVHTAASGETPEQYTVTVSSGTVTSSTAWGTLTGACGPALNQWVVGTGTVSSTCTVATTSGTFAAGQLVSFAGTWHEVATILTATAPSGGHQTLTLNLRRTHESGSWLMQGGLAGSCAVFTANIGDGLKYPITVLGALNSTTLVLRPFQYGYTPGAVTSYAGNLAGGGSTAFTIYPCAEVTDVQGGSGVPPSDATTGATGNTTFSVEPNSAPWTSGDNVEVSHDPGARLEADKLSLYWHNPCAQGGSAGGQPTTSCPWFGYGVGLNGSGFAGHQFGDFDSGYLAWTNAFEGINASPLSGFKGWGGYRYAPNFMRGHGGWESFFEFDQAPNGGVLDVECPYNGSAYACTSTTPYALFHLGGLGSVHYGLDFYPGYGAFQDPQAGGAWGFGDVVSVSSTISAHAWQAGGFHGVAISGGSSGIALLDRSLSALPTTWAAGNVFGFLVQSGVLKFWNGIAIAPFGINATGGVYSSTGFSSDSTHYATVTGATGIIPVGSSSAVAGHAACMKTVSPLVIGTCSTQPDSGGACTCN